ncbi:hypothetical protein [Paenibacillus sp. 1011MAR3C5]|nr:hypothetical protein [Paenibacillus sp. 1011MAR3C5]
MLDKNKLAKNLVIAVIVIAAVIIVRRYWLPDGIIGFLFEDNNK